MAPPLKIVHVAAGLPVAGMENVVASLVRGMPPDRYHSAVWCIEQAGTLGQTLRAEGHEVRELGRRSNRDWSLFFRIAAQLRKARIDIMHCHDELGWFYGGIGASLSSKPRIVVTMHGRRPNISGRHLWEQRVLARSAKKIVCVSSYLRAQIIDQIKVSPSRVNVISNGILVRGSASQEERLWARAELGLSKDAFVAGCVGRLNEVKNIDLLIRASAVARHAVPSLHVVVIGDGPCRSALAERVFALGLNSNVTFAGLRQDAARLLPALDLYVCSSNYEGISLSILEAMSAGRAIIATAVGGNTEIIKHDDTGLLIGKDDVDALAQGISDLSQNPALRLRLGQAAKRAVVERFSLGRMIQEYEQVYQSL